MPPLARPATLRPPLKWAGGKRWQVLLNDAHPHLINFYRWLQRGLRVGFAVQFLDAPRRISCTGDRTPAREIMAARNL
jgi:DNA adenine methylase